MNESVRAPQIIAHRYRQIPVETKDYDYIFMKYYVTKELF